MAKKLKVLPTDLKAFRTKAGLNQSEFWHRYGTTQSGGSRYESGRGMPSPLQLLMRLHLSGAISDEDLKAAKAK
jgi:DNA-binding transcriptional regulator YiaG